jgi:hypothetical protein
MATARRNAGLIYIEYRFAAGGTLDYLQFLDVAFNISPHRRSL